MTSLTSALQWRYATKKFDASKKLSESDLQDLLEAVRLAPSSYGIQPWKFLVISDPALRAKLREAAWGQPQVTDASQLIVLCAKRSLSEADIDRYLKEISAVRGAPAEQLEGFKGMMMGSVSRQSHEELKVWNQKQVYIALGVLLSACAAKNIDSCPMEGFDKEKFDEILGLEKENLTATVLCPVGYRAADDEQAAYKKVRLPLSEIIEMR